MESRHKSTGRSARGRKAGHALKFHNFYVANERLCQSSSSPSRRGERTLTQCLREEHGTKQITVSHWTTTQDDAVKTQDSRPGIKTGSTSTSEGIKIPADHQSSHTRQQQQQQQHQSILQSLLANNLLSEANQSLGPATHVPANNSKVNKRKPLFVRRLLPHHHPHHPLLAPPSAPPPGHRKSRPPDL